MKALDANFNKIYRSKSPTPDARTDVLREAMWQLGFTQSSG
jgi:hypothetical protein